MSTDPLGQIRYQISATFGSVYGGRVRHMLRRLPLNGWATSEDKWRNGCRTPVWLAGWRSGSLRLVFFSSGPGQLGSRRQCRYAQSATSGITVQSHSASAPLDIPRFVNVASLNVRHSTSGELIMMLPRGPALRVLDRQEGWLLVAFSPTLEGWVAERLTTTQVLQKPNLSPASLTSSR